MEIVSRWPRGAHGEALQVRELATRGLAEHLARSFSGHRALVISNPALSRKLNEMEKKYDSQFKVVFEAIRRLLTPPPVGQKQIGFRATVRKK